MPDIDFLPAEYRQKHLQRQSRPWQVVASVLIIGLVAVAAVTQNRRRRSVQDELAIIAPAYEAAVQQQKQLAELETRLKAANATAELYTYLRHPWPRTQLLRALVVPMPGGITLQQVQILREAHAAAAPADIRPPVDQKSEDEARKSLTPAQRDLAKLRGRLDPLDTVVVLAGTATDSAMLHRYLADLDATDIFDKAELDCFNSVDGGKGGAVVQFRAVLLVQPGYGQPGGPADPDKKDLAQASRQKP